VLLVKLSGRELDASEVNGSAEWTITRRRNTDTGGIETDFAGTLEFSGRAYQEIKAQLIDVPNGRNVRLYVEIVDDCCELDGKPMRIFYGYLAYDSLKFCMDECKISADLKEWTQESQIINCIKSTYIFDNTFGFQQQQHPFVRYCGELRPNWLMQAFLIIGLIVHILLYALFPLIILISLWIISYNAIVRVVCLFVQSCIDALSITDNNNDGLIDWWQTVISDWDNYVSGCFRGHPAPFVRDYLLNVCRKCGLVLKSTLFNQPTIQGNESWNPIGLNQGDSNPYFRAMWLYAPVRHGEPDYVTWIDDNKPLLTLDKFLNELKKIFDADYRIVGNELRIERRDYFIQSTAWIDMSDPSQFPQEFFSLCVDNNNENNPAWGRFEPQKDAVDWVGNEAFLRTAEIVNWDVPAGANQNLIGEKTFLVPFSPVRARTDGIDEDILDKWRMFWDGIGIGDLLVKSDYDFTILLPLDMTSTPKVLIWDGESAITNAKVIKFPDPGDPTIYDYNNDVTFSYTGNIGGGNAGNNTILPKAYLPGNLYDRIFFIEDPKLNKRLNRSFTAVIKRDCALIQTLSFDKSIILPQTLTQGARGVINEVEISVDKMTIKGSY
jgi:hypothetical protein